MMKLHLLDTDNFTTTQLQWSAVTSDLKKILQQVALLNITVIISCKTSSASTEKKNNAHTFPVYCVAKSPKFNVFSED